MSTTASVIVRAKDEAGSIERTLARVREQTLEAELIVVDSGSTDGTIEIARRFCDRIIELPPERFSYGRALNVGAEAASAPIHFALSAHCVPERCDWIERSLAHYERPDVAGTNGAVADPHGRPLLEPYHQDGRSTGGDPLWGYSNHAGSWRAEVRERFPFDEQMVACEDKEWASRVRGAGWVIAFDPFLTVSTAHRQRSGIKAYFARVEREARALSARGALPRYALRDALEEWWSGYPADSRYPPLFHRANYYRVTEIAARYVGGLRARRGLGPARRGPQAP